MTIDHDYERFMVMKVLASNQAWNLLRDGTVMVIVTGHSQLSNSFSLLAKHLMSSSVVSNAHIQRTTSASSSQS